MPPVQALATEFEMQVTRGRFSEFSAKGKAPRFRAIFHIRQIRNWYLSVYHLVGPTARLFDAHA